MIAEMIVAERSIEDRELGVNNQIARIGSREPLSLSLSLSLSHARSLSLVVSTSSGLERCCWPHERPVRFTASENECRVRIAMHLFRAGHFFAEITPGISYYVTRKWLFCRISLPFVFFFFFSRFFSFPLYHSFNAGRNVIAQNRRH